MVVQQQSPVLVCHAKRPRVFVIVAFLTLLTACSLPAPELALQTRNGKPVLRYGIGGVARGEVRFVPTEEGLRWTARRAGKTGELIRRPACLKSGVCYRAAGASLYRKDPRDTQWVLALESSSLANGAVANEAEPGITSSVRTAEPSGAVTKITNGEVERLVWLSSDKSVSTRRPDGKWARLFIYGDLPDKRFPLVVLFWALVPMAVLSSMAVVLPRRKVAGRLLGILSLGVVLIGALVFLLSFDRTRAAGIMYTIAPVWAVIYALALALGKPSRAEG